jgi:hypothetical protein
MICYHSGIADSMSRLECRACRRTYRDRGEGGMQGSRDTRTYRHETPHPRTIAPIVLLIVGGTAPGFMIESESVSHEREDG